MATTKERLASLHARGFDDSYIVRGGIIKVRCSQCAALVISGIAAHETGCTNARRECSGCNAIIPIRQKYCEECNS